VDREAHRIFPPFHLDAGNAQLWRDQERIILRPKTFDVLRYLVDHPGELVTKATLLDAVWPEVSVSDSLPATCIAELRRALGDDAKTPRFIETVHRRGYRFIADMTTAAVRQASRDLSGVTAGPKPIIVGRKAETRAPLALRRRDAHKDSPASSRNSRSEPSSGVPLPSAVPITRYRDT
jgi:DNA-binding winged helix-turn-helix (wHTH) protein